MSRIVIALAGLALLAACNENNDRQPVIEPPIVEKTAQELLDENQTLWANANLSSYTYVYSVSCFCAVQEDIVVNVRDGDVASAFFTPSGALLSADQLAQQRTFDGFFGFIQTGLDDGYAKLDVTYNEQYGYPVTMDVDVLVGLADDESFYRFGGFQ